MDAQLLRGADDPHGDLAAIGNEQALDGHGSVVQRRQNLTGGHRRLVLGGIAAERARGLGLDLDEGLHHLDQPDHVAHGDRVAADL